MIKDIKFVATEQITLEEVNEDWVSVTLKGEKFVFDTDTLCDLSFSLAALLAKVEERQEQMAAAGICDNCASKVH